VHLLLINQFYLPDLAPTGQLLADVARGLADAGHSVEVVCSSGSYGNSKATKLNTTEGVLIRRIRRLSFGHGLGLRIGSYASFLLGALHCATFGRRPDVIVTLTTPPLLSLVGTSTRLIRGSRHVIWEMDMYPDVAVAVGFFPADGLLDRMVGVLADLGRRQADRVIALGPCMRERLESRGVPGAKITVAHNWVDGCLISPRPFPRPSPLVLLYSGNLGRAHDTATVGECMRLLSDAERFQFIFTGGGSGRAALEVDCYSRQAVNVHFLPYKHHEALANHLGRCHLGLITQGASTCGTVVPSKTYGLMAAGRPFIFIGPSEATPARLIKAHRCGWHIEPGNSRGLVDLLELLARNPHLIQDAGGRGREAFLQSYDLPIGADRVVKILIGVEGSVGLTNSLATHD
jgi:colanic acid biosynthesis glycosyl transferase WcaI